MLFQADIYIHLNHFIQGNPCIKVHSSTSLHMIENLSVQSMHLFNLILGTKLHFNIKTSFKRQNFIAPVGQASVTILKYNLTSRHRKVPWEHA